MRFVFYVYLSLVFSCFVFSSVAAALEPKPPAVLHIEFMKQGKSRLVNSGMQSQLILHARHLQPTELILRRSDGTKVRAFDSRSIEKFDAEVYCHLFVNLEPKKSVDLFEMELKKGPKGNSRCDEKT